MKVFLCHASGDKAAVRHLYKRLQHDGIEPWLDEEALLPGQEWEAEIRKAVRESDIVLVCLSKASITKRGFVQKEIKFALDVAQEQPEGTIFLIPAKLEECVVPQSLSRWQWVNLFADGGYEKLLSSLRRLEGGRGFARDPATRPDNVLVQPGRNNTSFRHGAVSAHRSI